MTYKPNYDAEAINREDSIINLLHGFSSQKLLESEEVTQRIVAESDKWLLTWKSRDRENVKAKLEEMGFTSIEVYDDLFFSVQPPEGWTKETIGYWTTIKDQDGNERISQFFKGAIYDRSAHLSFIKL